MFPNIPNTWVSNSSFEFRDKIQNKGQNPVSLKFQKVSHGQSLIVFLSRRDSYHTIACQRDSKHQTKTADKMISINKNVFPCSEVIAGVALNHIKIYQLLSNAVIKHF